MPVSHIGLTVSHLPTSCSFFLEALQPLGYKYLGQDGGQIGFGIRDPDFFICQESHGNKAGAAHIAFSSPTCDAVDEFYTRAIRAGAKSNGRPGIRDRKSNYYSASVLDFDGNSIEVVHRPSSGQRAIEGGHGARQSSKVLTWQKDIAVRSVAPDTRSVVSSSSFGSAAVANPPAAATATTTTTTTAPTSAGASTTLIGTLIGVAAGAAAAAAYFENSKTSETPAASVSHTLALDNTPPPTNNNTYALEQGPTSYYAPPSTVARTTTGTKAIEAPPPIGYPSGESYICRGDRQRSEAGGRSVAEPLRRSRSGSVGSHHHHQRHQHQHQYHPHSARVSEAPESIVSSFVAPSRHKRQEQQYHVPSRGPSTIVSALDVPLPRSLGGGSRYTISDDDDMSTIRAPTVTPSESISQASSRTPPHTTTFFSRHRVPKSQSPSTTSTHRTPKPHSPSSTTSAHKPRPAHSHARSIVSFAHGSSAGRSSGSILGFPIKKQLDDERGSVKKGSATGRSSMDTASVAGGAKGYTLYEERRMDG
ncbi:MAG: hypothetical protein M1813_005809 [Trichoglossum hirsutum]|nr:MAG: hypothetical protein M1813_005809 [Trichoglossum hirsutum]